MTLGNTAANMEQTWKKNNMDNTDGLMLDGHGETSLGKTCPSIATLSPSAT